MVVSDACAFTMAKFCYAWSRHKAGGMSADELAAVCDELASAIVANDTLYSMTRNERSRRYGWHPRDQ